MLRHQPRVVALTAISGQVGLSPCEFLAPAFIAPSFSPPTLSACPTQNPCFPSLCLPQMRNRRMRASFLHFHSTAHPRSPLPFPSLSPTPLSLTPFPIQTIRLSHLSPPHVQRQRAIRPAVRALHRPSPPHHHRLLVHALQAGGLVEGQSEGGRGGRRGG